MSGKSTLIHQIIRNLDRMTDMPISKIIYYYSIEAINLPRDLEGVELREGAPDHEELMRTPGYKCVIIDDALGHYSKNKHDLMELFTKVVHHASCLVFLVAQSLFKLDRVARTNCQYIILTRTPDKLQIRNLAAQLFPSQTKYIQEAFDDAVYGRPYGHLLLDLHPLTEPNMRVIGDILDEHHTVYLPRAHCS